MTEEEKDPAYISPVKKNNYEKNINFEISLSFIPSIKSGDYVSEKKKIQPEIIEKINNKRGFQDSAILFSSASIIDSPIKSKN